MFFLTLSVLICCHVFLLGIDAELVIYSHPETTLPVMSGLVRGAKPVPTSVTNVIAARQDGSGESSPAAESTGSEETVCDSFLSNLFRRPDGACNNRINNFGQSIRPLARLLPPEYDDGLQAPRAFSVVGSSKRLPGPRLVSRVVHPDLRNATTSLTIFVMQWGQFMDHELVSTPLPVEDTRGVVECCGPDRGLPFGNESSECFPILFPPNDPDFRGRCMSVVRSQPVKDAMGKIALPRENMNLITSFIDASLVYGSTAERLEELRNPKKRHLLRTSKTGFPPDNGLNDCIKRDSNDTCFLAGDDRVNEQPGLTLMHVIFLRYHNILAKSLRSKNPFYHDDFIFEQARAIVGAVMQNIMYSDWLPIILGPSVRQKFNLDLGRKRTEYDPSQDPRIVTSFSTAVFRFGHTLIPRSLPLTPNRRPLLREVFFKPFEAVENLDTLADGLSQAIDLEDRSQPFDRFLVEEVTSHLFENQEPLDRSGFDLVSLNIQRGRDHGLPSYNAFREILGLGRVTSFQDPVLGSAGSRLQQVYEHVDDIDLFSGGLSEEVFDGGLAGETFSTMMGLQFHRLKFGDRFFFTHRRVYHGFNALQVWLIRKISLSMVLCLTTNIDAIQPDVFRIPGKKNQRLPCRHLRRNHPNMRFFVRYPF